jgi:cytochrome c551/c552
MRRFSYVISQQDFDSKRWTQKLSASGQAPGPPAPPPAAPPPSGSTGATGATGATGPTGSGGSANVSAQGKALFTKYTCASCHTLTAAGANGKIGPDLDKLAAEAQKAGQPLEQFIRDSIVDPNKYIEPGFPKGLMPQNFGTTIPKADLDTLVQFLVQSSKGGGT